MMPRAQAAAVVATDEDEELEDNKQKGKKKIVSVSRNLGDKVGDARQNQGSKASVSDPDRVQSSYSACLIGRTVSDPDLVVALWL
jgi:hypothetical protein